MMRPYGRLRKPVAACAPRGGPERSCCRALPSEPPHCHQREFPGRNSRPQAPARSVFHEGALRCLPRLTFDAFENGAFEQPKDDQGQTPSLQCCVCSEEQHTVGAAPAVCRRRDHGAHHGKEQWHDILSTGTPVGVATRARSTSSCRSPEPEAQAVGWNEHQASEYDQPSIPCSTQGVASGRRPGPVGKLSGRPGRRLDLRRTFDLEAIHSFSGQQWRGSQEQNQGGHAC